jgi:hypothetical protein
MGVEPTTPGYHPGVLPLNYAYHLPLKDEKPVNGQFRCPGFSRFMVVAVAWRPCAT